MPVIKKYETLADFVASQAGNMNALFAVAFVNGASITDMFPGGQVLELPDLFEFKKIKSVQVPAYVAPVSGKILKKHQNNTDFVCQHFGTMESLFELAALNGISITEAPVPGVELKTKVVDDKVVLFFEKYGTDISSRFGIKVLPPGGIGYMKISSPMAFELNDFIVS